MYQQLAHVFSSSAGQSSTVSITIDTANLAVWTLDNKFVVEPGAFKVKVGTSAVAYLETSLTVS